MWYNTEISETIQILIDLHDEINLCELLYSFMQKYVDGVS